MKPSSTRNYGSAVPARRIALVTHDGCALNVHVLCEAISTGAVPVLFVHALAMDGQMWQGVADALQRSGGEVQGAMYALDCRGHGASGMAGVTDAVGGEVFTTARFARDVIDVMDGLSQQTVHLVGCSMGGTVALAVAGRHPERVASLTVIDATAWYGPDAPAHWEQRAQKAMAGGMASLVEFQLARWFSPGFLAAQPDLVRQSLEVFTANRVPAYAGSCRMLGQADEREGLAAYGGPASVVVGEDDYATPPAMAGDIARRLTGATLTVIAGARHYTPLEAPEQVATCIAAAVRASTRPPVTH